MRQLGVGYRGPIHDWLMTRPPEVKSLEITAEHFFDRGEKQLRSIAKLYPTFVHGLGLSLGTPGSLCETTLDRFARVAEIANAQWVSEHVAFTRTDDVDLGHLNPVPFNRHSLSVLVDHAQEVSQRCARPLILENITSDLAIRGELSETEFLNLLCDQAKCGLLLDVTNLFINSKNHGFDPLCWLHEIQPRSIKQLHVVGYTLRDGHYHDHHSAAIQDDLMELIAEVVHYSGVESVTLERDDRLDAVDEIQSELRALEQRCGSR